MMTRVETEEPATMTAVRFEEILKALDWSKRGASLFFGVTDRTMARWIARNHVALPVAMVLELMLAKKLTPRKVLEIAKMPPERIEFILSRLHRDPDGRGRPWS